VKAVWQTTPFEDCIEPVSYTTKIQRKDFLSEGAFPIVSQEEDLINGRWENDADLFKVERPLVLFGDHTRSFKYVDFDFVLGADGVKILKPKAFLHPRYFYFQLHTANLESLGYARHYRLLKEHSVSYPDFAEQRRIVTLLDEAFADIATAKANAEKNLKNTRSVFECYLLSVLNDKKWKWSTLGDLCTSVEYGSSAKSKAENGIPVLRMGNIQDGRLDWKNLVFTDDQEEIQKYLLKQNDVLFNRTNSPELVGKTAIYKSEMPAIFAGYLIRIHRKDDLLDGDFLTYFLNSQIALDYGKTVVISSVNQANINGTKLKSYPMPAPSLTEQKTIVKKLDELAQETHRLESIYRQKLTALDNLKKSLLHQAFSGQL
jgi:type I restriction enzyme S subunit